MIIEQIGKEIVSRLSHKNIELSLADRGGTTYAVLYFVKQKPPWSAGERAKELIHKHRDDRHVQVVCALTIEEHKLQAWDKGSLHWGVDLWNESFMDCLEEYLLAVLCGDVRSKSMGTW